MKITKKQSYYCFEDLNAGDVFEYPITGICIKLPEKGNVNAFSLTDKKLKCFCGSDAVTLYSEAELILKQSNFKKTKGE